MTELIKSDSVRFVCQNRRNNFLIVTPPTFGQFCNGNCLFNFVSNNETSKNKMLKSIGRLGFLCKIRNVKWPHTGPVGWEDEPKGPAGLRDGKKGC